MSAKVMLGAMVTVSVLAVAWGARDRKKPAPAPVREPVPEVPWLTKEAAAQIIGPDGTLGPLFATMTVGGLVPTSEERERVAEFARANNVAIELEVNDDELVAIRFDVSYSGCCGYEGAEVLALRAHRPTIGGGCMGGPERWLNSWGVDHEDGTYLRARVDINRVTFRWERRITTEELLDRASDLVGADTTRLANTDRDHWRRLSERRFVFAVPYHHWYFERASDGGVEIYEDDVGRVSELSFFVHATGDKTITDTLKAHLGRPSVRGTTWTWRKGDRVISTEVGEFVDSSSVRVTMRLRAG